LDPDLVGLIIRLKIKVPSLWGVGPVRNGTVRRCRFGYAVSVIYVSAINHLIRHDTLDGNAFYVFLQKVRVYVQGLD